MKTYLPLLLIGLLTSSVNAGVVSATVDFDSRLPRQRKAIVVPEFSDTLFSRGYNNRTRTSGDVLAKATLAKIEKLTINGLIWSDDPASRAVLAGDHILRTGAKVPAAMVSDETLFQVKAILMDKVILEADVLGANPLDAAEVTKVPVELPLSLRDKQKS